MPVRKRYLCTKVRQNNGIIHAEFERDVDGQPEIIFVNLLAHPGEFEEGKWYWWYTMPAFPQPVKTSPP